MPDSWLIVALCFAVFEPFGAQVDVAERQGIIVPRFRVSQMCDRNRDQLAASRLLHEGDVWRLDLTSSRATIFLCLSRACGASVEGLVAYWHPRANLHQEAHEQGV